MHTYKELKRNCLVIPEKKNSCLVKIQSIALVFGSSVSLSQLDCKVDLSQSFETSRSRFFAPHICLVRVCNLQPPRLLAEFLFPADGGHMEGCLRIPSYQPPPVYLKFTSIMPR